MPTGLCLLRTMSLISHDLACSWIGLSKSNPHVQMVYLGDIYASEAGKLTPPYVFRCFLLLCTAAAMGNAYGSKLLCMVLPCISFAFWTGTLIECYGETVPGVLPMIIPSIGNGVNVYLVPGLYGWEGTSLGQTSAFVT